jgi:hypothetical protein
MKLRLVLLAALALPATLAAQVTTGTILGTVVDSSGAVISGAKITITEITKATSQQFTTDDTGAYNAPFLVPGTYQVAVEKEGFKREVRSGIVVEVDRKARIDVTLAPGAVTETIEVTAAAPLVRSESAELGEVITERAVRELPLNGRNFAQLVPGSRRHAGPAGRESLGREHVQSARGIKLQRARQPGQRQRVAGGRD